MLSSREKKEYSDVFLGDVLPLYTAVRIFTYELANCNL